MLAYRRKLKTVFDRLNAKVEEIVFPRLGAILGQATRERQDAWTDSVHELMNLLRATHGADVSEDEVKAYITNHAKNISHFTKAELTSVLAGALGVDVMFSEPWLRAEVDSFVRENVHLIVTLKEKTFADIERMVKKSAKAGDRVEELQGKLRERFGITERHAELIARDQTSKLAGNLNELRQREAGLDRYTWRGVLDERERDSHVENEGQVFTWDDPPAETGHPGEDYQCRCVAEPIFDF